MQQKTQVKTPATGRKNSFGFGAGVGVSRLYIKKSDWQQETVNYADSITGLETKFAPQLDLSLVYQHTFNDRFFIRSVFSMGFSEGGKIIYHKHSGDEEIKVQAAPLSLAFPFVFKLFPKKSSPYAFFAPAFCYTLGQQKESKEKIPLKTFDILLQSGFGYDIAVKSIVVSPEMKISSGFFNLKKNTNTYYTNTINKLSRVSISLGFILRDY